ncbi:sigma factor, RpoE [Pseudooceanicola batsensis HTCC2597]|uniref:RNA polymerase sigma factor n=1 Tax=Pseudooceanicola batsensis (strain ATCC BAA-863 / DSM 15984 / KCTC 12145 / HTCC2597) TaxID=252305 RepID=A3U0G1_PSEBH|nr:sigma-70 family RNA polymerase sigma factor [Pseudooceanicola batsensis]EAQ02252.1 sigma factor, RpoE [Pseudooceanicola batsensis HTCC2597]
MRIDQTDEEAGCLDPEETVEWIPALRAFARSLARNAEEADDLVQETLLKAIRHREKFRQGTNLRAWLFTILRNTFYNGRVKSGRERPGDEDCVSSNPWTAPTQEWSIRGNEVMAAVDRLPIHYREMFILVVMLGESYETSAEICEVAMGTVKSRVNRARAMIIEDLGDREV